MGDSYERSEDAAEAREAYEQFLFFFPASEFASPVRFRLGTIRFEEGDYMQAAVDFTTVLEGEVSPETAQASLYNLGLCQIQLGQATEAAGTLERFRKGQSGSDPRLVDVAYRLGELYERGNRFQEAIPEYERALNIGAVASLAVELHYRIGACREALDKVDAALASYRQAVKVGARDQSYHLSAAARIAEIHEARGEYGKAVEAYRTLIRDAQDQELVAAAQERVDQLAAYAN